MKKKYLPLCLISLGLLNCAGGSGSEALSVRDPNGISSEFEAPTGSLSSENATAVVNRYVTLHEATRAIFLAAANSPKITTDLPPPLDTCITRSSDAKEQTENVKCMSDAGYFVIPDFSGDEPPVHCTASGTLKLSLGDLLTRFSAESFSYSCPIGDNESIPPEVSNVNGTTLFQVGTDEPSFSCSHVLFTVGGIESEAEGCTTGSRSLVDGDSGPVIIHEILFESVDETCSTLCVDVQDSGGSSKVLCDVAEKHADCAYNNNSVIEVDNCIVEAGETCNI